ncbi:MAG: hypothetical protein RL618_1968 [Pseudomonadota bacterium]
MDSSPRINHSRYLVPSEPLVRSSALETFHQAVSLAKHLQPEQRYAHLQHQLDKVSSLSANERADAFEDLAMMASLLSSDDALLLTDSILDKFLRLSELATADQRDDDARKIAFALLSAGELHDRDTMIKLVVKLGGVSRTLGTDHLAKLLVEEVQDHLPDTKPEVVGRRLVDAAALVPHLPAAITQSYLEMLSAHLPQDHDTQCFVLPALLSVIEYAPGTEERLQLFLRLNQQLYRSRIEQTTAH